ncbi:MAG: hypothetical protein COB53_11955 [Elusimicrobia bacterium]|nr:MAG: hypothetical protein COB53_11955 [Elusimicrobiota bacterium]
MAAIIVAGLHWLVEPDSFVPAVVGILTAYAASTLSVAILLAARSRKVKFDSFMKAYGAGVAIRAGGLLALVVAGWGTPTPVQSALLASYTLGVLVLLLVEYRQVAHTG